MLRLERPVSEKIFVSSGGGVDMTVHCNAVRESLFRGLEKLSEVCVEDERGSDEVVGTLSGAVQEVGSTGSVVA